MAENHLIRRPMQQADSNPTACLIIIGNEILSGRTQDSNLAFIGKRCDQLGIRLRETRIIPDVEETIASTVNECRCRFTYLFTTGGIGPTHDDITSAALARAFDLKLVRNPAAVAAMDQYYEAGKLNEARLKMADVPETALLIDNPVSGAPGFQLENVFVLPGVPLIMQAMFEGIVDRLTGGEPMLTMSIATNLTEGQIARELDDLQARYQDISIGSYPYFKKGKLGVNIVSRGTDQARLEDLAGELENMILHLDGQVLLPENRVGASPARA